MSLIQDFCNQYGLPNEATTFLECEYQKLLKSNESWDIFHKCIKLYEQNYDFAHERIFEQVEAISQKSFIHKYTLDLLYLICLTPYLKELYALKNIDVEVYDNSVCDLKWKAKECFEVYGVWGTFVGWWTIDFFKLKRFALGRLQFNLNTFSRDFPEKSIKKGDIYIETHIPSSGPLKREEYLESYKMAAEFFKEYFPKENIIFGCYSWLLSPDNIKILPASSNILPFMGDYEILSVENDVNNTTFWRIFATRQIPNNLDELPTDTTIRRAFAEWLKKGNELKIAFGILRY